MCPSNIGLPRQTFEVPRTGPLAPSPTPIPDTGYLFLEGRTAAGAYQQLTAATTGPTYYLLEGRTE